MTREQLQRIRDTLADSIATVEQYNATLAERAARLIVDLDEIAHEDRVHARNMTHQRNLALFALGCGIALAFVSAVCR